MTEPQRPEELASGYEALRAQAIGELPSVTPRGLVLFLSAGFPDWMRVWVPLTPATPRAPAPTGDRDLPLGLGGDVVRLLTEMALGCQRRWATT